MPTNLRVVAPLLAVALLLLTVGELQDLVRRRRSARRSWGNDRVVVPHGRELWCVLPATR